MDSVYNIDITVELLEVNVECENIMQKYQKRMLKENAEGKNYFIWKGKVE